MTTSRLSLLLALPLAMLGVATGVQASCTAAARQYIQQGAQRADQIDQATRNKILDEMVKNPPPGIMGSNGINDCVAQNWPSIPGSTQVVLSGLGRQIVNQLCTEARQRIAAQTPGYLRDLYSTVQRAQSGNYSTFGSSAAQTVRTVSPGTNLPPQTGDVLNGLFGGGSQPPVKQ